MRGVIFLDIDGVLNRTVDATHIRVDADLVERLRRLVEDTNAFIVLSTFWRHFQEYITYILSRHGIPAEAVIGRTPGISHAFSLSSSSADAANYANRAAEIRAWLDEHPNVTRFVIIDDRSSASNDSLAEHFVQTEVSKGLTDLDVERCRELLREDI